MTETTTAHLFAQPEVGRVLPTFTLPSAARELVRLRAFKQRRPVLLVFLHALRCSTCMTWLHQLDQALQAEAEFDVAALVVTPEPCESLRPLTETLCATSLLSDTGSHVASMYVPRLYGDRGDHGGHPQVAAYVADRYGYCLAHWEAAEADHLPSPHMLLRPIEQAERGDCGCGQPAWPELEQLQPGS